MALGLAALAAAPYLIGNSYYVNIVTQILIGAVFALGLNIIAGYGGLVSLGSAGLFGISAYTAAVMLGAGYGHMAARAATARAARRVPWAGGEWCDGEVDGGSGKGAATA